MVEIISFKSSWTPRLLDAESSSASHRCVRAILQTLLAQTLHRRNVRTDGRGQQAVVHIRAALSLVMLFAFVVVVRSGRRWTDHGGGGGTQIPGLVAELLSGGVVEANVDDRDAILARREHRERCKTRERQKFRIRVATIAHLESTLGLLWKMSSSRENRVFDLFQY